MTLARPTFRSRSLPDRALRIGSASQNSCERIRSVQQDYRLNVLESIRAFAALISEEKSPRAIPHFFTTRLIDATNLALEAARDPYATDEEVGTAVYGVAVAVQGVADEYALAFPEDVDITYVEIWEGQQEIVENGLPQIEVDILEAAGMSQDCIDAIEFDAANRPIPVEDTTVGEMLASMPAQIWPFEDEP